MAKQQPCGGQVTAVLGLRLLAAFLHHLRPMHEFCERPTGADKEQGGHRASETAIRLTTG